MRFSIRFQLLLPLFILLLGVVGISTWTGVSSANRARRGIETDVRNVAHTLSDINFTINRRILGYMKQLSGADFVYTDLRDVVTSDATGPTDTFPLDANRKFEFPRAQVVVDDWQTLGLGLPVEVAGERYLCSGVRLRGGGTLYILYPEQLWRDALWDAIEPSLVLGVFGGLASLVLAVGVAQRLGRRIQGLEKRTRQIAAGDFSPMPLPRRNDELRDLSRSVNDMAQQLSQLQETLKQTERLRLLGQVGGGLAHQLRNGVTGARLALQIHERECTGKVDTEGLDVALRQLDLMEANLKRFLALGQTEQLRREPCDLGKLIAEAIDLLRPQCRHTRTELCMVPPTQTMYFRGDAGRLGHLFLNVIGNAVEAAGPGGRVEVVVRNEGDSRVIEVADTGPGPPTDIASRLFQPFVTGKPEGIGLGLAVAYQVAVAHGGGIDWRREDGRTIFRIRLPATESIGASPGSGL